MVEKRRDQNEKQELPLKLALHSMRELERLLGTSRVSLRAIEQEAGSCYSPFESSPRARPFQKILKPHKARTIDNPLEILKTVQRRINRHLLGKLDFPCYLCGGVRGRTVLDNVLMHFGAKRLVAIDIKSFFPSITNIHIYDVWRKLLGCSDEISGLLTRLTTVERHLPQGAPTSTLLANLVLHMSDGEIRHACTRKGITYTSWVDDLAFSGMDSCEILEIVIPTLNRAGFSISRRKIRIMGPGDRKTLTGVLMGKFPSLLKDRLSQLRSGIHKIRTRQVPPSQLEKYVNSLKGRIVHVGSIVPLKAEKLRRELEAVCSHF